jgi:hypothetical protein
MTEKIYIRVYLKQDPAQEVVVSTTYDKLRSKRNAIKNDIRDQKFSRWAPFANQTETSEVSPKPEGYILETLDDQKRPYHMKAAEWNAEYDAAYQKQFEKSNDTTN